VVEAVGTGVATRPMAGSGCQVGVAALGESKTPAVGRGTQEIVASVVANREEICGDLRRRASVAARPVAAYSFIGAVISFFDTHCTAKLPE